MTTPRGIRSCNPFNLRELPGDRTHWEGERTTDDDPAFEEFDSLLMGLRAGIRTLLTYQRKHKLRSVRQMINRFAPPNENDTNTYIENVCRHMGVLPDDPIDLNNEHMLLPMVEAIVRQECGTDNGTPWCSPPLILAAMQLAQGTSPQKTEAK